MLPELYRVDYENRIGATGDIEILCPWVQLHGPLATVTSPFLQKQLAHTSVFKVSQGYLFLKHY